MKYLSVIGSLCLALVSLAVSPFGAPLRASPQSPVAPAANALQVPMETTFLASLISPIPMAQVKAGDRLEALTTQDIKQGHDVLLKKGAMLLGQVDSVELATAADTAATIKNVVIAFDRVRTKKGEETPFHLVIQALAPQSDIENDSVPFATGRGVQGATVDAAAAGHARASRGTVNPLTTRSSGVQDLAGLELRERITDNKPCTVIAVSRSDIQLKKDTQLVMKVVR